MDRSLGIPCVLQLSFGWSARSRAFTMSQHDRPLARIGIVGEGLCGLCGKHRATTLTMSPCDQAFIVPVSIHSCQMQHGHDCVAPVMNYCSYPVVVVCDR